MNNTAYEAVSAGIENLLKNCARLQPGQKLLIVCENEDAGYYDRELACDVAATASNLGITSELVEVKFNPNVTAADPELQARIAKADHTLFLARIGDQLRFAATDRPDSRTISYALDRRMMGSNFGGANYDAFVELKTCLNQLLWQAADIWVTCPLGTDFRGSIEGDLTENGEVSIKRFPMSVFKPISPAAFSGRIAQAGFLVGTGSNYYTPYACALKDTLFIQFDGSRITGFDGTQEDMQAAKSHYEFVGKKFGIDPYCVHSWHGGIHPGCAFVDPPSQNFERWTGGAFGNPRLFHFHTCGDYPPGEISLNIVDATVKVDDMAVWEDWVLHPERIPGGAELLATYPCMSRAFANPDKRVGLNSRGRLSFQ
jgi:hypothetical protein